MGKRKKKVDKVFCYYCDREFDDEKILVQHQKAKHYKCHVCNKKLSTASGMVIHILQVHKESVTKVPNAKPERESVDIEIFGMQGIPPEVVAAHYGDLEEDTQSKMTKVDIPTTNFVGGRIPGSAGMGFPPHSTLGAMQPMYNPALAVRPSGWLVPPRPQPWFVQHSTNSVPPAAPVGLAQQPLFPIQNMTSSLQSTISPAFRASFQATSPIPTSSMPTRSVCQPLFPVGGSTFIPSQSTPAITTTAISAATPSNTSAELRNSASYPSLVNSYHTSNYQGTSVNSHTYASGPNTSGPSIGPPPMIANKVPTVVSDEVYLVWDDEAMSMEERRMSLLKYQVHDETSQCWDLGGRRAWLTGLFPLVAFLVIFYDYAVHSNLTQMNSVDAAIDRRISESRLAGRMSF